MADNPDRYAFEKFPRGQLSFCITRKQFFEGLVAELQLLPAHQENQPVLKLSNLGALPDRDLAWIVPVLTPGSQISEGDGFLWSHSPALEKNFRLFPSGSPAHTVLQLFNGERNLLETCQSLAKSMSWDKKHAFAYARGVFLWLVLAKMCVPKSP